ncbi:MAG: hypothetical protein IJA75_03180 [Oscillospiraceae bacterium]|nr:hypothetical protein [Oscillospiraceae bacterium]
MGDLMGFDDWLQAQNCVLGAALLEPELVPRVVTELTAEDFSGNGLLVYKAMADLFRQSRSNKDVDPVAIVHYLGGTAEARTLVTHFMSYAPHFSELDRYIAMARDNAKVSRLRSLGSELSAAVDLKDAVATADAITDQLVERQGLKGYEPSELLDSFAMRHRQIYERIEWKLRPVGDYIRVREGRFLILGAEPSGGKTAFALEQMWAFSATKRVLFISLETDEDTLFDRMVSSIAGIPMDALMDGKLSPQQWEQVESVREEMAGRTFKILPAAGLSVSGIKAAAIGYRADIVIIDYLQIIQVPGKNKSRYEAITEISMALHILAQTTGLIILALSQVTNRDPQSRGKPLGIHSARESGQIEADADAIMMLDKCVEKALTESGCNANRILRIVKNKNGRCVNIPLLFKGEFQTFTRAYVPNLDWENAQKEKKQKQMKQKGQTLQLKAPEPGADYEQLPMDTKIPF